MAQKFVTPITIKQLSSASSDGLTIFVDADTYARLKLEAGGRLTWGDGSATGDTNLYRSAANTLKTDDTFQALSGVITLTTAGEPTVSIDDGAMAVDTTNNVFYYRSSGVWRQVSATASGEELDGGGAMAGPVEAEVTNYITIQFDGGEV